MQSAIYKGIIRHRRETPARHEFTYPICLLYLDLGELTEVFASSRWYSADGPALAQFRREDHLGDPATPLDESVRKLVRQQTGRHADGPIRLLTHLRYLGYVFNPVSFYYCFNSDADRLEFVVAEVNNTPWGERHCYVLDVARAANISPGRNPGGRAMHRWVQSKQFHVSPFMPMDIDYNWRMSDPGQLLSVHMENHRAGEKLFDATLVLQRQPLTAANLRRVLLEFPLQTLMVMARIHWQALRLWLKRVPVITHPGRQDHPDPDGGHPESQTNHGGARG